MSKGSVEGAVAAAVAKFQREQQGRGTAEVRAYLIGDVVMVRCKGIFTPTEARLATTDEGRRLVKSARQELRTINRAEIEGIVASLVSCPVVRSYYDVDAEAAEQVEIFILAQDAEQLIRMEAPQTPSAPLHSEKKAI